MDPCFLEPEAYERAKCDWLCTACANPVPAAQSINVKIQEIMPASIPLNFIMGCGVGIAQTEFLIRLGQESVEMDLYLGRVFNPEGSVLKDWVTFRGRHRVIVRGEKNVGYRRCKDCGQSAYFAMGEHYLYPRPPYTASLFDAGDGGLVVTKDVFQRIRIDDWSLLIADRLPVLDKPKDGLPDL